MENIDEIAFVIKGNKIDIVTIQPDYFKLPHIQKLEVLLTIKNWVKDELDKIANT